VMKEWPNWIGWPRSTVIQSYIVATPGMKRRGQSYSRAAVICSSTPILTGKIVEWVKCLDLATSHCASSRNEQVA
jgi:hypothetical protein